MERVGQQLRCPAPTAESDVTLVCRMDGAPPCAVRSPVTCSGLSPGEHRFEVYAENAAGRKYDTVKWSFLVL